MLIEISGSVNYDFGSRFVNDGIRFGLLLFYFKSKA